MDLKLSSEEMATTLGLKDKAYERMIKEARELKAVDGKNSNDPDFPPHLRPFIAAWNLIYGLTSRLATEEYPAGQGMLSDFSHLYLPQLLDAHVMASTDGLENPWTKTLLLLFNEDDALLHRFLRSPVEGAILLEVLYDQLGANFSQFDLTSTEYTNKPCEVAADYIDFLTLFTLDQCSGVLPRPTTSTSAALVLIDRLQALNTAMSLQGVQSRDPRDEGDIANLSLKAFVLEMLLTGEVPTDWFETTLELLPWWRCEGGSFRDGAGGCKKKKKDAKEWMECERCRSVRYCSIAHKKAHWKVHKKRCWDPVW